MPIDPSKVQWDDEAPDPAKVQWDDAPAPAPTNTFGQEAMRQGGQFLRAAINAAASPAVLLDRAQAKASDYLTGKHIGGTLGEDLNARLTGLGVPTADRPIERFTQGIAESAPAFALPASLAPQVLGNAAISAAQARPGEELTQAGWGAAGGAAVPALGGALKLAGKAAAPVLGTTTGAGAESVRQAFKGGDTFTANMRGHVEPAEVVTQARAGIQNMRNAMQADYKARVPQWATGHPVDFAPVEQSFNDLVASMQHNGKWKIGPAEQRTINEIDEVLTSFRSNPANHTVEGFDALKQRLSAIYPESPEYRQAQRAVSTMTDAVRNQIVKQSPVYADAMKDYWRVSQQLDEIERTLSLGKRTTTDTALRKLQSLTRNNVNTNYGQRLNLVQQLEQHGGADVLPAVAGQALNSWTPRGLQALSATGVGGYGLSNPASLAALPAMSPRLVGETARATGQIVRDPRTQATLDALRRLTPATVREVNRDDR